MLKLELNRIILYLIEMVLLFPLLLILMHLRLNLITLRLYRLNYLGAALRSYVVVIPFFCFCFCFLPLSSLEGSVTALIGIAFAAFLILRKVFCLLLTRVKLITT